MEAYPSALLHNNPQKILNYILGSYLDLSTRAIVSQRPPDYDDGNNVVGYYPATQV